MSVTLINPHNKLVLHVDEFCLIDSQKNSFPLVNGAWRFVPNDNYTKSFGYQWNIFDKTQLDTNEITISKLRLFNTTQWKPEELENKNILEVGSGAGRFTRVMLEYTNANIYSVDYSNAVEANYKNNGPHKRLFLFQASLYELPFTPSQFDKVLCLGVLQHSPDFEKSIKCLIEMAKPGGEIVVDFYSIKGWWTKIHAKYLLRPLTKKMSHKMLLNIISKNASWLIKAYFFLHRIKLGMLTRFLPICDIIKTLPYKQLSKEQLKEWVILDTFDMFSPQYDNPKKISTIKKWFEKYGTTVTFAGYVQYAENQSAAVIRATKNN